MAYQDITKKPQYISEGNDLKTVTDPCAQSETTIFHHTRQSAIELPYEMQVWMLQLYYTSRDSCITYGATCILFMSGEVLNLLSNQMPGQPCWFSNQPEKHKLGTGREDLSSCKLHWILLIRCQGSHVGFFYHPEKHKLGRGRWVIASCQILLNSSQWLQRSKKDLCQSELRVPAWILDWLKYFPIWMTQLKICRIWPCSRSTISLVD